MFGFSEVHFTIEEYKETPDERHRSARDHESFIFNGHRARMLTAHRSQSCGKHLWRFYVYSIPNHVQLLDAKISVRRAGLLINSDSVDHSVDAEKKVQDISSSPNNDT